MNTLLRIVPKRWYSWDFTVLEGAEPVADIDISWWREKGILTVRGEDYAVYREGLMSGSFVLESKSAVLARADKPSAFHRAYSLEYLDERFTLRAKSAFRREFVLLRGSSVVGTLRPEGIFTRRARIDLPEELLLPVRVFDHLHLRYQVGIVDQRLVVMLAIGFAFKDPP